MSVSHINMIKDTDDEVVTSTRTIEAKVISYCHKGLHERLIFMDELSFSSKP